MTVNGFKLPDAFVNLINQPDLPFHWVPKEDAVDTSGRPLSTVLPLEIRSDPQRFEEETAVLHRLFREEDRFQDLPPATREGGSPPDPDEISRIVWFGTTASGEPYCFDFRENPAEPSVIHWDDGEWLRLANNFSALMSLFEPDTDLP